MNLRFSRELPSSRSTMLGAFAHPAFAIVWTASTCALIGIAMYDTASGWLMTTFDLNPFDVSLLHTATTLPIFLFTLPAGAVADIVDPRRMIIAVSYAIAALMTIFAALVALDDLGVNLKPARAMGMTTIKVVDAAQAITELKAATGLVLR